METEAWEVLREVDVETPGGTRIIFDIPHPATARHVQKKFRRLLGIPKKHLCLMLGVQTLAPLLLLPNGAVFLCVSLVEPVCASCEFAAQRLRYCSACYNALYCSPECQQLHWHAHRSVCNLGMPPVSTHAADAMPHPWRVEEVS